MVRFISILKKVSNSSSFLSKIARSFEVLSEVSKGLSKLVPIWTEDEPLTTIITDGETNV